LPALSHEPPLGKQLPESGRGEENVQVTPDENGTIKVGHSKTSMARSKNGRVCAAGLRSVNGQDLLAFRRDDQEICFWTQLPCRRGATRSLVASADFTNR